MSRTAIVIDFAVVAMLAAGFAARAQTEAPAPALTIDDAVALALKGNRQVRSSAFDIDRAREGTAAIKTQRLPQFQVYLMGGETLRPISFTIPEGALGVYPGTGPIPGQNATITTPQRFTGLIFGQISQPVSQQWKIHLASLSARLGEALAREGLRQQQQETAHSVRYLYYQMVQTQTQIESAEANVKYLVELQGETGRNLAEQSVLKGDSLAVKAKLSQQRYQLLTLRDTLDTQKESLNRLLGRDLDTPFVVEAEPLPKPDEIDLAEARKQAISQRAEIRQARLQTEKAEVEVRRQRAEYIPDLSVNFTYLSFPNATPSSRRRSPRRTPGSRCCST
jgi:outer membrane protein TolC